MNERDFIKAKKIMGRIQTLSDFIGSVYTHRKSLSHMVLIHQDNTKNIVVPEPIFEALLDEMQRAAVVRRDELQNEFESI